MFSLRGFTEWFPRVKQRRTGATLDEVLLSVAVLAALFIIVASKMDIVDIFAKLSSTGEAIGMQAIGEAVTNYRWANGGNLPPDAGITSALKPVCKQTVSLLDCQNAGGVFLGSLQEGYLQEIPVHEDFSAGSELMTGYKVQFPVAGGRFRVEGPSTKAYVH